MKRLVLTAAVSLMLTCIFLLSGCENANGTYELDGMSVSGIAVVEVKQGYYNFELSIRNQTSKAKDFDVSRFTLKLNDSSILPLLAGSEKCPAKKSTSFAIMIDSDHPDMKVGDSISVYFDDSKLCDIKIKSL